MLQTLRTVAVLFTCALSGACTPLVATGPAATEVEFVVSSSTFVAGDTVSARLVNRSDAAVGFNLCSTVLEHLTPEGWVRSEEQLIICTMELRSLPPGEAAPYRRPVSASLPEGQYRLRTSVEAPLGGEWVTLTTEPFMLTRPAAQHAYSLTAPHHLRTSSDRTRPRNAASS